jgi:branched-chain amino acid transport system ATP-binding protein
MLKIEGLTKQFGGLIAVSSLDLTVNEGDIFGLIGPNGAGKTTVFNLITGFLHPTRGRVGFTGKDITGKKPHQVAATGLVRTFQANNICPDLTVLENVILSCHLRPGMSFLETVFATPSSKRKDKAILDRSRSILELVGLEAIAGANAGSLAHGHKRTLGIAVALAADPKLLMLDEPFGGMNAQEVNETMQLIKKLWERGITILLIEHNMRATMSLCQRIAVVSFGKKIAEGTPVEVQNNDDVIRAYFGSKKHA